MVTLSSRSQDKFGAEGRLGSLVEEMTQKLLEGQPVDFDGYLREYPECAGQLRELLPAMHVLADLGAWPGDGEPGSDSTPGHDVSQLGVLGDFRILREIGHGGMGVVYEAEQVSLGRRVALKVLPFAAILDQRQLARFKNEAHAAACLQHQNIVPVYSVGCERGVHYYAMQYVEGHSLAEVIRQLRRMEGLDKDNDSDASRSAECLASDLTSGRFVAAQRVGPDDPTTPPLPYRGELKPGVSDRAFHETLAKGAEDTDRSAPAVVPLSAGKSTKSPEYFRSVARVGIQAAEAIEHAHDHGVVHRDIKPGNLLLDAAGNLWITDFGLARVESDASVTMTGDILGTLRYMSPEQTLGKRAIVDYRTDIYSLGATLYELLTLQPAYTGSDRQELLQQIALDEPRRPRAINRAISTELETIVLKAMEKRPEGRYATSQELADDLRRFLESEPIRARRPTLIERLDKWSRRHRALVASAVSITIVVLAATTLVALSRNELAQRRLAVQTGINNALAEATRLRGQVPADALGDQTPLMQAREQVQRALALAESGPTDAELVAQVRQLSGELDREQRDRQLLAALDKAWLAQADTDVAAPSFDKSRSISILHDALAAYGLPVAQGSPEQAAATIRSGPPSVQEQLLAALEECRGFATTFTGVVWRVDTLVVVSVIADSPAGRDGRLKEGDVLVGFGQGREGPMTETRSMTPSEFRRLLRHGLATIIRLQVIPNGQTEPQIYEIERDPTVAWLRAVLEAADTDSWRRRLRAAIDLKDESQRRAAFETLVDEADIEQQPVKVLTTLALQLREVKAVDGAIALLKRVQQRHPGDVIVNSELGEMLRRNKPSQFEEAVRYHTAAVALRPDSALVHNSLGIALAHNGQLAEAVAEFRHAIRVAPQYAASHSNLGVALQNQRKLDEAVAEYREAIRLKPDATEAQSNLGFVLYEQGKLEESIAVCREAIRLNPYFALAHNHLGAALGEQGKHEEAIGAFRDAIRLKPDLTDARSNLGYELQCQGKVDEAIAVYREALRVEADSPEVDRSAADLGAASGARGKMEEAIAEYRKAIRRKPEYARVHFRLGDAFRVQGKLDEAIAAYRDAIRRMADFPAAHNALGNALRAQGKVGEAIAVYREAIRIGPDAPYGYNSLAWLFATAADPKLRRPGEAVDLAKKAVELASAYQYGSCVGTLGTAQYRAGQWKDAAESLEKAIQLDKTQQGLAFNGFFLAMARCQLGEKDKAREWYDKSVAWIRDNKPDDELTRFRAEAEELLGIVPDKPEAKQPAAPSTEKGGAPTGK